MDVNIRYNNIGGSWRAHKNAKRVICFLSLIIISWGLMCVGYSLFMIRLQRECLRPASVHRVVVYTTDMARYSGLLQMSGYRLNNRTIRLLPPDCWRKYDRCRFGGHKDMDNTIMFIGRIRADGDSDKMVVVAKDDVSMTYKMVFPMRYAYWPFSVEQQFAWFTLEVDSVVPTTYYQGYIDPLSNARFLIPFEEGDRHGTIVGSLGSDGAVNLLRQYLVPGNAKGHTRAY